MPIALEREDVLDCRVWAKAGVANLRIQIKLRARQGREACRATKALSSFSLRMQAMDGRLWAAVMRKSAPSGCGQASGQYDSSKQVSAGVSTHL